VTARYSKGVTVHRLFASAAVVAVAAFGVSVAPATGASAAGGPAVLAKGTLCSMAGADASGNLIDGGLDVVTLKVENAGNVVLNCNAAPGTLVNASGRTQTYRGFQCFIISPVDRTLLETYDTNATVTANGAGQVTCRYSKP
jgi:hypothetical protein